MPIFSSKNFSSSLFLLAWNGWPEWKFKNIVLLGLKELFIIYLFMDKGMNN